MKTSDELPTDFWKKTILDIKDYIGSYFLRFYGGEPFLRTDLLELTNFCLRNNIPTLITTNGTLIDQTVANELAKNRVVLINISLDGFKAEAATTLNG
jgi:MoaA/NifB/PqqE/SkfB family radical SAM enzyme